MKQNLILLVFLFFSFSILPAQGISINADGTPPDASAILDVQSTTKGILIPRVYSLSYESFVVPLVKAMQEQQEIIEELMRKMEALEERMSDIEAKE